MQIILAALGALITILILVNRLSQSGIDIGWLNPFTWKRRREWAKRLHTSPIYSLRSPLEVTALLMVGIAKCDGDMSAEQKNEIKSKFKELFHLNETDAAALITSSAFLLKDDINAIKNVSRILEPSINAFTEAQATSAIALVDHIANFDSPANQVQVEIIASMESSFKERFSPAGEWA